jgi:hypothetical protein
MGPARSRYLFLGAVLGVFFTLTGERPPTDPRFSSPAFAVRAFWQAVLEESPAEALECFAGAGGDPDAARRLRIPPLAAMELRALQVKTLGTGRAVVQYQVHYRTRGSRQAGAFAAADEVVRVRGQWRILRPLAPAPGQARLAPPPPPPVHVRPGPDFA